MANKKKRVARNPLKAERPSAVSSVIGQTHNQQQLLTVKERVEATKLKFNPIEAISAILGSR